MDNLPRHEVLQKLIKCDILLQPSFHDSGTYVCAEAMASGRPVICLNLGGQAIQINEETGLKFQPLRQNKLLMILQKRYLHWQIILNYV